MEYTTCIKKAKEVVKIQRLPPKYSPNEGGIGEYNCYAYALLLSSINWEGHEITPGFMSGPINLDNDIYWDHITGSGIIQYVKEDLEKLGRKMEEDSFDKKMEDGTYKIAIYVNENGFHLIRQNQDGSWSEKCGWAGRVELIYPKYLLHDYKLIGVYKVSNQTKWKFTSSDF